MLDVISNYTELREGLTEYQNDIPTTPDGWKLLNEGLSEWKKYFTKAAISLKKYTEPTSEPLKGASDITTALKMATEILPNSTDIDIPFAVILSVLNQLLNIVSKERAF